MSHPTGIAIAIFHASARQDELAAASLARWLTLSASNVFLDRPHSDLNMQTPRVASKASALGHQQTLAIIANLEARSS